MPHNCKHNATKNQSAKTVRNWPNRITLARLLLAPTLIILGRLDYPKTFLALFAILLLSDMLDGYLARHLHQQTELGTQLDTAGDVTMCVTVMIGGWFLWPEIMTTEAFFLLIALGLLVISGLAALIKFHRLPSYHNWTAKISTTLLGSGVWLLFANATPWVFRIAVGFLAASAIEETTITFIAKQWHPNVPTIFHAFKKRQSG